MSAHNRGPFLAAPGFAAIKVEPLDEALVEMASCRRALRDWSTRSACSSPREAAHDEAARASLRHGAVDPVDVPVDRHQLLAGQRRSRPQLHRPGIVLERTDEGD